MKNLISIIIFLLLTSFTLFGQGDDYQQYEAHRKLRSLEEDWRSSYKIPKPKLTLSKEDWQKLQPHEIDLQTHKEFLKNKNTGIFKLFQDRKCYGKVINVNDLKCLDAIKIYGNGSYFSFTEKTYFRYYFTEIYFADGMFSVYPLMPTSFGMIKDLGNVPLESIDELSIEIKDLINFKAPKNIKDIDANLYQSRTIAKLNNTFAARYVHYPTRYSSRRKSNLFIFRVVVANQDESVTIVWKKIKL
jgi:hypothetical protein